MTINEYVSEFIESLPEFIDLCEEEGLNPETMVIRLKSVADIVGPHEEEIVGRLTNPAYIGCDEQKEDK